MPIKNGNGHALRHREATLDAERAAPRADVIETKDALIVELDLPGHALEDIDVRVTGPELTVRVERKLEPTPGRAYHRCERPHGIIERSFTLPSTVDTERTSATYRAGVLCIELPKRDEVKPRTIPVSTGD